jgi:5-hydroxyisourate hydrolase-like protein (transthyretin family)
MLRAITISLLALLLISAQALPQTPTAAGTGSIEGIVVRSDTGAPIAGAQVTLTFAPAVNLAAGAPVVAGVLGGVVGAPGTANVGRVAEAGAPPPQQGQGAAPTALNQALAQAAARPTFQPVVTNAEGKFAFKDLAAGGYRVAALADGFVRQEVGQRTVNSQGRPVFVTAGQTLKDATIRLIATGTVSGRVFDENGQPATGAPVQLLRAIYNVQGRNLQSVATGVADDRGDYRAFGVPPGQYYLIAGTPPNGAIGLRGGPGGPGGNARFSLLYYPAAESIDQALTIEVKSGAEAKVDMRLRRQVQTYRVRGRVVDGTGAGLPANLQMQLTYRFLNGSGGMGQARSFDPATGTFELQNVPPGEWGVSATVQVAGVELLGPGGVLDAAGLAARQAQQAQRPSGTVPIRVVDKDVEGLILTLSTGVTTTGRISVEGQPLSTIPNLATLRFGLTPVVNTINQNPPVIIPPDASGAFQVVGLREMEYRAQFPAGAVPGLYVKSITYGGEDILNKPLKFSGSGSGTFDVVLRTGAVQITGTVTDAKSQAVAGVMVVLIPAQRNRTDLFRPSLTDQNGRFTVANVPPGEYKLFSWEALDANTYFDPEVLKQFEQQGKSIQVTESSNQSVDVKLIPAP